MTTAAANAFNASIPRNYYLLVHDACRHVLGPEAKLAAFVKAKKPFQCDMVINSSTFDPPDDIVLPPRKLHMSPGSLPKNHHVNAERRRQELADVELVKAGQKIPAFVTQFGAALQSRLGVCDVQAHRRRLDVIFRDRHILSVALGGKPDITEGSQINSVGPWEKRNPLRIALGFDEDLFQSVCDMNINMAARGVEKTIYTHYQISPIVDFHPKLREVYLASGCNWRAVAPPIAYWQAHCYALCRNYPCRHVEEILSTVEHNFSKYYGRYPFLNPYCEGEDLNTMDAARFVSEVWSLQASMEILHKVSPVVDVELEEEKMPQDDPK